MRVICLLVCSAVVAYAAQKQETLAPVYGAKTPLGKDEARKPLPAKGSNDDQVEIPVMYSSVSQDEEVDGTNPTHVRAADDKVIISQDPLSSYNSTGKYHQDATATDICCLICPKDPECQGSGCHSKCHRMCGDMCQIGKGGAECTIGINCGLVGGDSMIAGAQDMVKGYDKLKAPAGRNQNTPDAPIKDEERFPLPEREEDKKINDGADIAAEATGDEVKDPYPAATGPAEDSTGPAEEEELEAESGDEEEREVVSEQMVEVETSKKSLR